MASHLFERFPDLCQEILRRLSSDDSFGELCADYEALAVWLSDYGSEDDLQDLEWAENRQLLAELETEILMTLQATDRDSVVDRTD